MYVQRDIGRKKEKRKRASKEAKMPENGKRQCYGSVK
jgi:hypothetical protein